MEEYSFRKARPQDVAEVRDFLNKHWGEPHPLLNDERLLNHYFCDEGNFNFALCLSGENIAAIAGFIYSSEHRDAAFVSIWCADKSYSGAGLELMNSMCEVVGTEILCCNNIRPKTMPFYHFIGFKTGQFTHAYMLAEKKKYELAIIEEPRSTSSERSNAILEQIYSIEDDILQKLTQRLAVKKDAKYIKHRYIDYPFSTYRLYCLKKDDILAIIALRVIDTQDAVAIKLVDFIGDPQGIVRLGQPLRELMLKEGAEFVEFYCAGVKRDYLERAGFNIREETDKNIIPTYLEPPDRRNVDFYYFTNSEEGFTMFRADGDGDRPMTIF